jgi:hypothetical protein
MTAATNLIDKFTTYIIDPAILLIFSFGFLMFVWGLVQFMMNVQQGNEKSVNDGKQHMLWGIVGMLIMISVYGIIALIDNTFQLGVLQGNSNYNNINNVTAPADTFQ